MTINIQALNNTFNIKDTHDAILDIQMSNYNYLKYLQEIQLGYSRFDNNTSNILVTNRRNEEYNIFPNSYYFTIPYNIIANGKQMEYRKSKFFNTRITYNDMISNHILFQKIPLIFINSEIKLDLDFYITESHLYCIA